jgi:hypothetical protein
MRQKNPSVCAGSGVTVGNGARSGSAIGFRGKLIAPRQQKIVARAVGLYERDRDHGFFTGTANLSQRLVKTK